MAHALQTPCIAGGIILEGGAIDCNGQGVVLTTEACLLNPNRNPGLNRDDAELRLRQMLGATQVVWLEGFLEGDDTDGHIDQLARFVQEDRILVSMEDDASDVHFASSQRLMAMLQATRSLDGKSFEIIPMPGPAKLIKNGRRLPAGYANFYIANHVVLAPQYGVARDTTTIGLLSEVFPDRQVIAINCSDAVVGLGAIHCLTQQIPLAEVTR